MCKQVVINNSTPIWVCPNAMKQNEDCVFCKCHECYMENIEFTKRNSRRSARCQKINNEKEGMNSKLSKQNTTAKTLVECDHLNLNCCFDFSYFSREYLAVRKKKNRKLPITCTICHREIVNKIDVQNTNTKDVII